MIPVEIAKGYIAWTLFSCKTWIDLEFTRRFKSLFLYKGANFRLVKINWNYKYGASFIRKKKKGENKKASYFSYLRHYYDSSEVVGFFFFFASHFFVCVFLFIVAAISYRYIRRRSGTRSFCVQ